MRTQTAITFFILLLLIIGVTLIVVKRGGYGITSLPWGFPQSGRVSGRLTEEIAPELIVTNHTIHLEQGGVYELVYGPSGYIFQEKSGYRIIERLNLSGVGLAVNDVVAPHLWDWWFDGDADYVSFDSYPTPQKLYVYVYADVMGGSTANPRLATTGSNVHFSHRGWMLRVAIVYKDVWFTVGNGTYAFEVSYSLGDISGWHTYMGGYDNTTGTIYAGADGSSVSGSGYIVYGSYPLVIGGTGGGDWLKGYIAYVLMSSSQQDPSTHIVSSTLFLADPTFFNGTHYIDLVSGVIGMPYGNPARIPSAERPFLWLIKSLASDNRLHLRYVPPGSIFRIRYGGIVREYYIDGTPNAAGMIEDYTIDLAADFGVTTLSSAEVELIYPSPKVRVYAPSGFIVKVIDSSGATWAEVEVSNDYVDLPIPSGDYSIMLIAKQVRNDVYVDFQKTPSRLIMTIQDIYGTPIGGALTIVRDTATKTIIYKGVADSQGVVEVPMNVLSNYRYLTIEVKALYQGTIYSTEIDYDLAADKATTKTPAVTPIHQAAYVGGNVKLLLIGVGAVVLIAVVLAMSGTRRGVAVLALIPLLLIAAILILVFMLVHPTHFSFVLLGLGIVFILILLFMPRARRLLIIAPLVIQLGLLADTGLVLDESHVVVTDNFYVPPIPPWYAPGQVNTGSQLGFKLDTITLVVKGVSWKNALPPWDGHAVIRVVRLEPGWFGQSEVKLAEVEVNDGRNYRIKAWIDNGYLKISYADSHGIERMLYSTQVSGEVRILAQDCTPRLEPKLSNPSPINPIPSTLTDIKPTLILVGLGALILLAIILRR